MALLDTLQERREEILQLAASHGAFNVRVFGSVEIDWRSLAGFRNVLVHDYMDGIDLEQIWDALKNDRPELETVVQRLIESGS